MTGAASRPCEETAQAEGRSQCLPQQQDGRMDACDRSAIARLGHPPCAECTLGAPSRQTWAHAQGVDPAMPPFIRRGGAGERMNRNELRFRILFECYKHRHTGASCDLNIMVATINADDDEKQAAKIWLINKRFVDGQTDPSTNGIVHPRVKRINKKGNDVVKSVMDIVSPEMKRKDDCFDSLSKHDKIERFAAECLNNPAAGALCEDVLKYVISQMGSDAEV